MEKDSNDREVRKGTAVVIEIGHVSHDGQEFE